MMRTASKADHKDPFSGRAADSTAISSTNVLVVQHCAALSGSTFSGHLIARGMREAGWQVDVAFGFDGPCRVRYDEIGCRTHVVPHKNGLRAKRWDRSLRCIAAERRRAREFERLIRQVKPDVVYVNSIVSLAAAVAAKRVGVPCVWHIRELFDDVGGEMKIPALGGRPLVRRFLKHYSDRRVAISKAVVENILGNDQNVRIVPNAVAREFFEFDLSPADARAALGLSTDGLLVGVPGTLRPMKGHPFFLKAAARVAAVNPDCRFAITGDGTEAYRQELLNETAQLGLADRVDWLGTIEDMPAFYRACDLMCIPSVAEPFGRTAIEAFACGTPVVASAVGGLKETIDRGRSGLLVEYGDVDGLADAINKLIADEPFRNRLSVAAKEYAEAKFTASSYQAAINSIVFQTLNRSTT